MLITPAIRADISAYLERQRALLPTLRHVSGDDCEHCGVRGEIGYLEAALVAGEIEEMD